MTAIAVLYGSVVYMVFVRFKVLPWNRLTRLVTVLFGIVLLAGFFVAYENLTPGTSRAVVAARIVDVAPQVSGQVVRVVAEKNRDVETGAVLFEIDPTLFRAQVKELEATLALAKLRLGQLARLSAVDAASRFEVEQTEAQIEQLDARLMGARFNLENATVRAPFPGRVPKLLLKPGVQVSPARAVLTFVDTEQLWIFAKLSQRALQYVKVGDRATVSFPALPARVFETKVLEIPSAIAEGQFMASGTLDSVQQQRAVRVYPVILSMPADFPPEQRRVGIAANVVVHTEYAGPIGMYASLIQYIKSALDAVL